MPVLLPQIFVEHIFTLSRQLSYYLTYIQ